MRRALAIVLMLGVCAGCTERDAAVKVDVMVRRAVKVGNSADTAAGVLYWGSRLRISDDQNKRLIFDLDAKTVAFIDKGRRTYIVRTFDEVVQKYEKQRAQRDAISKKISLVQTENRERIAGFEAREYTFATPRAHGAVWVTNAVRPPAEWHKWESLIAHLEGGFAGGEDVMDAVANVEGYPLRTTFTFGQGDSAGTITTQVYEIAPGAPPQELASIPTDFQRANDFPMPGES